MTVHVGGRMRRWSRSGVPGWVLPGAAIDLNFATSQYYGGSLSSLVSVSRASTGYAQTSGGVWVSFGNNIARITDQGFLIEESRTNLFLNSQSPATQTITVASGSTYTVSVYGTATVTLSGGGTGTATQGSPRTFTASTTSVVCTVTGAGGTFQNVNFELGAFATSPIVTSGASAARAADNITATGALLAAFKGSSGSFIAVTNGQNTIATQTAAQFFGFGSNSGLYYANVGNGQLRVSNSSVTLNDGSITSFIGINKAGLSFDGSGRSIVTNNGTVSSDANSIFTSAISTVFIGSNAAVNSFIDGNIQRLTVFNSRLPDATLKALTA